MGAIREKEEKNQLLENHPGERTRFSGLRGGVDVFDRAVGVSFFQPAGADFLQPGRHSPGVDHDGGFPDGPHENYSLSVAWKS